jgi:hypothetical protein
MEKAGAADAGVHISKQQNATVRAASFQRLSPQALLLTDGDQHMLSCTCMC